jgi:hypothetical protein
MKKFADLFEETDAEIVREFQDKLTNLKSKLETSNDKEKIRLEILSVERELYNYMEL